MRGRAYELNGAQQVDNKTNITTDKREVKEASFESAKQEILRFLDVSYPEFVKSGQKHGNFLEINLGDENLVRFDYLESDKCAAIVESLERIEEKLAVLFGKLVSAAAAQDRLEYATKFITDLLINDRADGENMPAIFKNDDTDLVSNIFNELDSETEITKNYRSLYYKAIINSLSECGQLAIPAIVSCLKEMRTFRFSNELESYYKLGKDTALAINRKKQQNKNDNNIDEHTEYNWVEGLAERDLRGGVFFPDYFIATGMRFEHSQFGEPVIAGLNALKKLAGGKSKEAREYVLEEILNNAAEIGAKIKLIVEILNQEPSASAAMLMAELPTKKKGLDKTTITKLLFLLELGKINMTDRGVEYLGKIFDLGKNNNERGSFAHRATGDGKVAVFDEEQRAIGYFQLKGLDSPDAVAQADFLEFTYNTLFHPKPGETADERAEREQILEEFKTNYFETYLSGTFYEETKVHFNNLNFK